VIARRRAGLATALAFSSVMSAACGGDFTPRVVDTSAVPAADPGSGLAQGWERGVFAEIFVRAYKDSDGDGVGDLRGLTEKLDYLQALGVSGIWLMPIAASQDGDHGYAVTDYRDVEQAYGSLDDLDALVAAAHARGIGVIVDYVMNHSAAQHPAFQNAKNEAGSPFRSWYVWADPKPSRWSIYGADPWHAGYGAGGGGYYFGGFWSEMPDWNLRNEEVVRWHLDNLRFWLNRGVDGFRFDAVGNLVENGAEAWENQPENYALMGRVHELVRSYERRYLVCEAPADPLGYAAESACGSAFAFGRQHDFIGAARGQASSVAEVAEYLRERQSNLATMASNHDTFAGQRLFEQVGGDLAQYKLAAASYLLQSGPAFIYYGEEVGMAGAAGVSGDPKLRTPMSWTGDGQTGGFTSGRPFRALASNVTSFNAAAQEAAPDSLLAFYRSLIALRKKLPALAHGSNETVVQSGLSLGFRRALVDGARGGQVVVAINYGTAATSVTVSGLPANAALARELPAGEAGATSDLLGQVTISVPAQSVAIFSL
jgi:alpha-amylase